MLTISTHIKGGKLILDNRKRFAADLSSQKDGIYELTLKLKTRRTTQSNRYLWGIVYKEIQIRCIELGNDFTVEDVHDFCKQEFLKVHVIGNGGEVIGYKPGSTANLTKEEFGIYLDKIILFAAETLCITIPLPNEDLQFKF
jgi:hypothetical protein